MIPGVAFWIVFDWPHYGLQSMEQHFAKEFMALGLDIHEVKAIQTRGEKLFYQEGSLKRLNHQLVVQFCVHHTKFFWKKVAISLNEVL